MFSGTTTPVQGLYPNAPPTFAIHHDKVFVDPSFEYLNHPFYNIFITGLAGDNDGDQPASSTLDGNPTTFGHTNKINNYFNYSFSEDVYLSKIEVVNRSSRPQRFRDITLSLFKNKTPVFDFQKENNTVINNQDGISEWADLNTPTNLYIDFTENKTRLFDTGLNLEALPLSNRPKSIPKLTT